MGRRGIWDQAVKEHEIALNGDPYNPTFRMNLSGAYLRYGQALMAKRSWQPAIHMFHMAIYVDPNNIAAIDCLETCIKATGKDPTVADVRRKLADEYDTSGNYPEAIAEYRTLVRMLDSGKAHADLGYVLLKQGESVPARAVEGFDELKIAVGKDWPKDQQVDLGRVHAKLGDTLKDLALKAKADGRTQTALKRFDIAAVEYRRAATLMNGSGNFDGVRGLIEVSREAVSINPRSFDDHLMLGGAYQLSGDFERAKKEYETCWQLSPGNPKLVAARTSYHLSVVTNSASTPMQVAYSVQKVEELLKKNPNDAELLYIYGRGKDRLDDHATAMQAYQAAAQVNKFVNPDLMVRLGLASPESLTGPAKGASAGAMASFTPGVAPVGRPAGQLPGQPQAQPGALPGQPPSQPPLNGAPPASAAPAANKYAAQIAQAQSKLNSGDAEGAVKDFTAVLDNDVKDSSVWYLLGTAQEKKGDLEEAATAYRQASLMGNADAGAALKKVNGSRAVPMMKKYETDLAATNMVAAKEDLKEALSIMPDDIGTHQKLLDVLKKLGDQKEIDSETNAINRLQNPPPSKTK